MALLQRLKSALALKGLICNRLGARLGVPCSLILAHVLVTVALALRIWLTPWLTGAQFITFFPAVILATLLGGTLAGVLSVALAAAAAAYFLQPGALTLQQIDSLALFALVALMDVAIISALLETNAALRKSIAQIGRLNADLRISEHRFRDLLELAPDATVISDRHGRIALVNAEAERLFGYPRAELLGQPLTLLMPERFHAAHEGRVQAFLDSPRTRRMGYGQQLFGRRRDGSEFPIETNLAVLPDGGREGLVSSAIRDATQRVEAEERQTLLMHELNHRVKNTLASVQAIVRQTLKASQDPRMLGEALTARLLALSQSHDALIRNEWAGADIHNIVAQQLNPYEKGDAKRFTLGGPHVMLSPNRAVTLGMALGELATNAAKYGALSVGDGTVEVRWARADDAESPRLNLVWQERGGPPVSAPSRQGFGSRLIERSFTSGLQGKAVLEYRREGVRCEVDFPLEPGEA